jgi:hypothetical protein
MQDGKFDQAKFVALFLKDDAVLRSCLEQGANHADLLAFLGYVAAISTAITATRDQSGSD